MDGRARGAIEGGVEIDLVNEDARADARGELAHFAERCLVGIGARRIVKVGDDDEPRGGRQRLCYRVRVETETFVRRADETLDPGAQEAGGGEERFVDGMLDQPFVAWRDRKSPRLNLQSLMRIS